MSDCTERHTPAPGHGLVREGQKGIPEVHGMTDCTERHTLAPGHGLAGEGQKGIPKVGTV